MRNFLALGLALLSLGLLPGRARAYQIELDAETIGQAYTLRAGDDTLVNSRRLTQYLGLNVYGLGPTDLYGQPLDRDQFYVSISMRFDAELGDFSNLAEMSGRTPQDLLSADRLELLYALVGGRDLGGFLDVKLGRQILVDLFDYQSFDGLWLRAKTPFHVAVEAWGGLNVTGAAPFDSPVFRADGVALGGNEVGSLAARQEDALEPTFGVALSTFGLRDVSARLSYSRTISPTEDPQPGEPSSGVVGEQVGLTARARLFGGLIVPWFGLRYNLLAGRLDELHGGARLLVHRAHSLSLEYVFAAPTFDGDSIWNVFGAEACNDARLTYALTLGRFGLFATGFSRFFGEERTSQGAVDPSLLPLGTSVAYGGTAGAALASRRGSGRLDVYYQDGYGGQTAGVDLSGRVLVLGEWDSGVTVEGRLSYVHFADDARAIDHADSLGVQAGVRYAIARGLTLNVAMEENVNRFYASQFRLLALLDISFFVGNHGHGFSRARGWGL